jgi:Protein of unknown function (DUF3306)
MCSVLLLCRYEARNHPTASWFMTPRLRRETPEGRGAAAKSRCSELITLLVLPVLVFVTGGAMTQAQENPPPILSSGLREATPVRTPAFEKSLFDVANLPPIESIDTASNIRPFLASGVPVDLTRAALRRAWSTDLAIRDFVDLSENSWDFNAPGVPGFGPLTTDDARGLLARVMEGTESSDREQAAAKRLATKSSRR